MDETTEELAYFDFLAAREAAFNGAVGQLVADNVPTDRLRHIAKSEDGIIGLAAKVVLYQRR